MARKHPLNFDFLHVDKDIYKLSTFKFEESVFTQLRLIITKFGKTKYFLILWMVIRKINCEQTMYRLFKSQFKLEPYLDLNNDERHMIT